MTELEGNPLARLIALAVRLGDDDADGRWIEAAVWRHIDDGTPLDQCLGIANPRGGTTWRDALRLQRRDDLLRGLHLTHFHRLSLHGASWKIATDFAVFRYRVWPRVMFGAMRAAYEGTPSETYFRLMAEGHQVPGPRQLLNILRKSVTLPCSAGADAVCADGTSGKAED